MGDFGVARDKWVCPNDRELSLRAKLKTGWSVKTSSINSFNKPVQLNDNEQEAIMTVIKRAENIEKVEQERVGRLVERLDNMKKNAMGNGTTQCVLCADEFGLLGASPLLCNDCKKAVCTKCGVDTISAQKEPQWLCKICAETRETWKKSGAWFYRGLPKYILPGKKTEHLPKYSSSPTSKVIEHATGSPVRSYNSWLQSKGKGSSDKEYTDSSDEEVRGGKLSRRHTTRKPLSDSVEGTDSAPVGSYTKNEQPVPDSLPRPSPPPPSYSNSALAASANVACSPRRERLEVEKSPVPEASSPVRHSQQEEPETYKTSPVTGPVESIQEPRSSPTYRYKARTPADDEVYVEKSYHGHYRDSRRQQQHRDLGHIPSSEMHRVRRVVPAPSPMEETNAMTRDPSLDDWTPDEASSLEFSLLFDPHNEVLHCTVFRAKALRPTDYDGLADPYIRLQLLPVQSKADKLRTRTVHKTLYPEFNETVSFYGVTEYDIGKRTLRLTVLDEDPFGNDFLGEARISLKRLRPHQAKYINVELVHSIQLEEGDEEAVRGQILLSLMYSNEQHALFVGILRCIHLPARDNNGYSDPFIKIQLKPDHLRRRYKTSVKKKTLNPEYNQEFFFEVKPHDMSKKVLEITVWDKDYGKTDDYIGGLSLSIQSKGERLCHWLDALRNPDRRIERWHPLTNSVILD